MKQRLNVFYITLAIAFWLPLTALAESEPDTDAQNWYQISLTVFKNRNSPISDEKWIAPDKLALSFPARLIQLDEQDDNGAIEGIAFRNRPPIDEDFKRALASLKLSPSYEVMVTKTWQQPAFSKTEAIPILIQAGKEYDGYFELEGSVELNVSRYLHVKADLWLADYIQQVELDMPWWQSDMSLESKSFGDSPASGTTVHYESIRTVVLQESRRMRSGELHYLDHPMFGVLVKVTPYELPPLPSALIQPSN